MTQKDDKKEKLKEAAGVAYGKLRPHELVWIMDAAIKHFAEGTKDRQDDLVRWERFPPAPATPGERRGSAACSRSRPVIRQGGVARAKEALERYRLVLDFLEPLKWLLIHLDAEAFGEDMRAHFFGAKLRVVKKK